MNISSNELREKFQLFFEKKEHKRILSAPLVPENDPSVLFTTAGMHPLVSYLKGQKHPQGDKLTNVQKCLRTTDIDEVGDNTHATVFEMLGNWSLGSYFKKEAIGYSWEFLTDQKGLRLDPEYLAVSVFTGDDNSPRDEESASLWHKAGVAKERIAYLDKEENWWPAGGKAIGPQGPDTEIFYWTGKDAPPKEFDANDSSWVEIWNDVFMEYNGAEDGSLTKLKQQNVDTGMGLERVVMVLNGLESIYEIDTYESLMRLIKKHVKKENEKQLRVLADHIKAATFMLCDEVPVAPANKDQGYVLRRVIRRAVLAMRELEFEVNASGVMAEGLALIIDEFSEIYPSLTLNKERALVELKAEVDKFDVTIDRGMRELYKIINDNKKSGDVLSGAQAFLLWESFGLPIEMTGEIVKKSGMQIDRDAFDKKLREHQEKSRTAGAGKFKGGLSDQSDESIKYHTATHLLQQALREVLGNHVQQRGSNITTERLRFDFSHTDKMTNEEIKKVENMVNENIKANLSIVKKEMSVEEAKGAGALGLFEKKYGDKVSVYFIGDFSNEICGGPHVKKTGTLGDFKITKEESSSAGVRRIKAVLEDIV